MAFTVGDFRDLVRLLEEHPEWRSELRRLVLSDELLELPAVVRQLAERMGQLAAAQVRTESRLDRIESALDRLVEAQGRTETRVGDIEGTMLELRYERLGPVYFSRMARRVRTMERTRLADLLDDAVDDGRLSHEERDAILLADAVFRGRRLADDADLYVLAEVSVGIGPHDVERASERAAMLEKLGRPVIPVVGGRRIDSETLALAGERGVWHSLEGRAMPPLAS